MEDKDKLPFVPPALLAKLASKFDVLKALRKAESEADLQRIKGHQDVLDHLRGMIAAQDPSGRKVMTK